MLVFICLLQNLLLRASVWRTAEGYGDARLERCQCFYACPWCRFRLFSVLSFWDAVLALQAYWPCHLGTDNLDVARTLGMSV